MSLAFLAACSPQPVTEDAATYDAGQGDDLGLTGSLPVGDPVPVEPGPVDESALADTVVADGPSAGATAFGLFTVEFSGIVICDDPGWPVQGVWVENADGSDGWARWWPVPGKPHAAKYRIEVSASRADPSVRLDVGCGRSGDNWRKTLLTPDFRTRHGNTENRKCAVTSAERARACKPAPKGPTAVGSMGIAGYCTDGAYRQWKAFTGYWPNIGGHANQMDDRAQTNGFQVSTVPHAMSMVVFNGAAPPYGHVGWVTNVYLSGSTVKFDYVDMNGGTGGTPANDYRTSHFNKFLAKTGKVWNPADQRFIVAPT